MHPLFHLSFIAQVAAEWKQLYAKEIEAERRRMEVEADPDHCLWEAASRWIARKQELHGIDAATLQQFRSDQQRHAANVLGPTCQGAGCSAADLHFWVLNRKFSRGRVSCRNTVMARSQQFCQYPCPGACTGP